MQGQIFSHNPLEEIIESEGPCDSIHRFASILPNHYLCFSVFKSTLCCLIVRIFHTDSEMLKDVVRFSRMELEVACEDFSNIIGSSPDSLVYKGTVKGGPEIAVISLCIKEEHWTGYLELYFQREVKTCSLSLQFFFIKLL